MNAMTDDQAVSLPPDARIAELETQLQHARLALAADHEGIRLWMLDCGELVEEHRKRADDAAAAEREACAKLVISDAAVAAAAEASDEWFGKDGDLKCGASELSRAQARVELAVVADLIRARTTP